MNKVNFQSLRTKGQIPTESSASRPVDIEVDLYHVGKSVFAHLRLLDSGRYNVLYEGVATFRSDIPDTISSPPEDCKPMRDTVDISSLLCKVMEFRHDRDGVFLPKVNRESDIIVDDPKDKEVVRIMSVDDMAYQKFYKVPLFLPEGWNPEKGPCSCSIRTILDKGGCQCNASK